MWSSRLLRNTFVSRSRLGRCFQAEWIFSTQSTTQLSLLSNNDHGIGNIPHRSFVSKTMPLYMPIKLIQVRSFFLDLLSYHFYQHSTTFSRR
jgi:hypothetical protein